MGASLRPAVPPAGRYELERELARGGMGVVHRALDRITGRTVALKRSLAERGTGSDVNDSMLRREYQTLVSLRHPNIIEVYDFGVDGLGPYYTMELLDGSDLRARCPLSWVEVCAYLRDVASSLALLHSRRLLHCDVSVANIRLTSAGRAKLLDFGALASFGVNPIVVGSPPSTAPEVLAGLDLDQRVDLYALGATAYYALTGKHAYPATMLSLLNGLWARGRPAAPSSLVPQIPRELDDLVFSLLDLDRIQRPASAAEVIDRLEAIAGLLPDQDQRVQRSYLYSPQVVGRRAEQEGLSAQLKQALLGRGGGVLIEGASGLGKTFLLEDLLRQARLAGALVLRVNARAQTGPFGTWKALLQEAESTQAAAPPRPSKPPLKRSIPPGPPQAGAESVFFALAQKAPLVLAIDDLHEADADTLAACALLAKTLRNVRIMLVATGEAGQAGAERPAMRLLRQRLAAAELRPFNEKESQAFVTGLFGDVPRAAQLAAFLHDHAAGNPRAYTEIIEHLIGRSAVRYAEGTWILPQDLPVSSTGGLAALLDQAFAERLERWDPARRSLALTLSPQRRAFDFDLVERLVEGDPRIPEQRLPQLLGELVRDGVLVEGRGSYVFARSRLRTLLYERLDAAEKQRAHGRLARALVKLAGEDPKRGFEIGHHFLLGGQPRKARLYLNRNVDASLFDPDRLVESAPDLSALLEHERQVGASDDDVQFIEGLLVLSGYYIDPSLQDRYGERSLLSLHRTIGLALAERLAPWLGCHLALFVGLSAAWLQSRFKRPLLMSGGSFVSRLIIFLGVCGSVTTGAYLRMDPSVHPRVFRALKLAPALGPLNFFRLLYDAACVGPLLMRGRLAAGLERLQSQLERVPRAPLFTTESRHQMIAGLTFFIGRCHLQRLDDGTLRCIEQTERLGGKHDRLMAQFLRRTHHLYRGDFAAAKREEERFDEMAALFGSRWIADMVGVLEFAPYHLAADVLGLKRTLHQIERLLPIAPNLATHREVVRAMYEGHRGRPDLALAIYQSLEHNLTPYGTVAWGPARAHQAECLNALGRHEAALSLCETALNALASADRHNVFSYQQLEREAQLALSGLGRFEEARARSDALLAEHGACGNPLVEGLLSFDRARIAHAASDCEGFELHSARCRAAFASTHNPALIARARRLTELARQAGGQLVESQAADSAEHEPLGSLRGTASGLETFRADRILAETLLPLAAQSAQLYLLAYGQLGLCAQFGDLTEAPARRAALARVTQALRHGACERLEERIDQALDARHGLARPLFSDVDGDRQLIGLVAVQGGEASRLAALDVARLVQLLSDLEVTEVV